MGLRLYQPPVESDIQSKPAADRTARTRSTIRRIPDRHEDRLRERRRRVLAAAAGYNRDDAGRLSSLLEPPAIPPATTESNGPTPGSERSRRARRDPASRMDLLDDGLRDVASRMGVDDSQVVAAVFGERWPHLHAASNPAPLRDDDNPSPILTMAVDSEFFPRRRRLLPPQRTVARPRVRVREELRDISHGANRPQPYATSRAPAVAGSMRDGPALFLDGPVAGLRSRQAVSTRRPLAPERASVDGLGDRNRSLSPEGDNVWDTLLSTLTPDPQPPSAGSSFASASASAAASQNTAAASSRTSLTTPDTAEDSAFEPPCESGCDNSDTEGDDEEDEDDEMDSLSIPNLSSLSSLRTGPRFYADATRGSIEDPLDLLGGIGGMQRIVRNLARREDIPDEWWAEVGLSRTLSREASSN